MDHNVETLRAEVKKRGSLSAAARHLGISRKVIARRLKNASALEPRAHEHKTSSRSISDFRRLHDKSFVIPEKLRKTLTDLGEGWVYESELLQLSGVRPNELAIFREEFSDHVIQIPGGRRAWAGTKELATQMRRML